MNQRAACFVGLVVLKQGEPDYLDTLRGLRLWLDGEIARLYAQARCLPGAGVCDTAGEEQCSLKS